MQADARTYLADGDVMYKRNDKYRSPTKPDSRPGVLAAALIRALDEHRIDLTTLPMLLPDIEKLIIEEQAARTARWLAEIDQRRAAWITEQGHLSGTELADKLGVSGAVFKTALALGFAHALDWPKELQKGFPHEHTAKSSVFVGETTFNVDQRRRLGEATMLSRQDAADLLGVTPQRFDRLRAAAHIRANIAGLYRLCDIETLQTQLETPTNPEAATTRPQQIDAWHKLNDRQQKYLSAIYTIDQDQEAYQKTLFRRGYWDAAKTPADQWRQIEYGWLPGMPPVPSKLYRAIEELGLRDEGTGSTFNALEARNLITCRYPGRETEMSVTLTTKGRKIVRQALGIQPTAKSKALPEWAWRKLTVLYQHRNTGIGAWEPDTYVTEHGFAEHHDGVLCITQAGRDYYDAHWQYYRVLYPSVEAPAPDQHQEEA